jgi:kynureninase
MGDFASTLSSEFLLPTNKAVGASKILGESGQCYIACQLLLNKKNRLRSAANRSCIYLAGNSLGALSKRSEKLVQEELRAWAAV